jgi:hypothetical protein
MGQANLRGTREERVATAVAREEAIRQARAEARRKREEAQERARAERWAKMTPEEREATVERAKREAENRSYLVGTFAPYMGSDTANVFYDVISSPKNKGY